MSNNSISPARGLSADIGFGPTPSPPAPAAAAAAPAPAESPEAEPADFQLVIEEDKAAGSFVYKTVNRRTGQVVSQIPRERILRMREAFDYVAGAVIKTKA
jgi:flagellar protein FlaG